MPKGNASTIRVSDPHHCHPGASRPFDFDRPGHMAEVLPDIQACWLLSRITDALKQQTTNTDAALFRIICRRGLCRHSERVYSSGRVDQSVKGDEHDDWHARDSRQRKEHPNSH